MNKSSGADPGFSVEGSADPRGGGGGTNIQFCQIFHKKKLHEIEKTLGHRATPPLRSSTAVDVQCSHTFATHFTDHCFTLNMNSFMCPVKKLARELLFTEMALVRL